MMVTARVKKGNSYGGHVAGTVVMVDQEELAKVPWCLEPWEPADQARAAAAAAKDAPQVITRAEAALMMDALVESRDKIGALEGQLEETRGHLEEARGQLTDAHAIIDKLSVENDRLKAELARLPEQPTAGPPPAEPAPPAPAMASPPPAPEAAAPKAKRSKDGGAA